MIPDFLQNPGGIQKPKRHHQATRLSLPTDADSTGSDFTRVLRDQQTSRTDSANDASKRRPQERPFYKCEERRTRSNDEGSL